MLASKILYQLGSTALHKSLISQVRCSLDLYFCTGQHNTLRAAHTSQSVAQCCPNQLNMNGHSSPHTQQRYNIQHMMICVRSTLLSLASHIESLEEQLGPFSQEEERRLGLCFRSSSTPDQSPPVRASQKPFLCYGSCRVNKKQAIGLYLYSSCIFLYVFLYQGKSRSGAVSHCLFDVHTVYTKKSCALRC